MALFINIDTEFSTPKYSFHSERAPTKQDTEFSSPKYSFQPEIATSNQDTEFSSPKYSFQPEIATPNQDTEFSSPKYPFQPEIATPKQDTEFSSPKYSFQPEIATPNQDICTEDKCLNAKCEVVVNGYKCRCNEGFSGERCEVITQIRPDQSIPWLIAFLAVNFLICILLLGICCTICRTTKFNCRVEVLQI
ncbi:hypothetical protein HNY73_014405 [Argiope bruennichi]|uniref:EGF-like domain-containing protein n=1 Tax=Argiope bruennichi TaxID=94029 RepID=A0A8T0EU57_ARGBR|nr:hypothetical protein HNY73_014405 [Argiope bruennichi]